MEVLATSTVNVTVPPGSGTEPAEGVLVVVIVGGTSVKDTEAESSSETELASSSWAKAVTVLVWLGPPAKPLSAASKVQENVAPAAMPVAGHHRSCW